MFRERLRSLGPLVRWLEANKGRWQPCRLPQSRVLVLQGTLAACAGPLRTSLASSNPAAALVRRVLVFAARGARPLQQSLCGEDRWQSRLALGLGFRFHGPPPPPPPPLTRSLLLPPSTYPDCAPAGTQKHVHLKCLRQWQESVQRRDVNDERAFRCSVCRALFSLPPPKGRAGLKALRGVGAALVSMAGGHICGRPLHREPS